MVKLLADSNHLDNLPPIYKQRMVWASSKGSETNTASSSNASEEAVPFLAREDATADITRDLDLPEDPEPSLVRMTRVPAVNEAGASNWQDVPKPFFPPIKVEEHLYFGPYETENIM